MEAAKSLPEMFDAVAEVAEQNGRLEAYINAAKVCANAWRDDLAEKILELAEGDQK